MDQSRSPLSAARNRSFHRYLRFWRSDAAADVDAELQFHLDARAEELGGLGLTPHEAAAQARRELGDVETARAECVAIDTRRERRRHRIELLDGIVRDFVIAARALRRSPGFAVTVALTLALGIGANSAMFSIVNALLFRPLPVPGGSELVMVGEREATYLVPNEMAYPNYADLRDERGIFSDLAAWVNRAASLSDGGRAERVVLDEVTANYFQTLRLRPVLGRTFAPREDEGALAHPVVVLSHAYWQRRFGGDSSIVGRMIRLNGHPYTIVGVAPAGFHGVISVLSIDVFVPLRQLTPVSEAVYRQRNEQEFNVIGRLAPGVSLGKARAAVDARMRQLAADYPATNRGVSGVVVPETRARPTLSIASYLPPGAAVFMALVALVLLIACVNVAALVLARCAHRQRELAMRTALGASRWRLVRHVLAELVILAAAGAAGAVLLAAWSARSFASMRLAIDATVRFDVAPDWRVMVFTFVVSLLAALVAGLLPALRASRPDLRPALGSAARDTGGVRDRRLRGGLVAAQVGVSLVVLVSAALFTRSASNAGQLDLGFRVDRLMLLSTNVRLLGYDSTRGRALYDELLRRAQAMPGVKSAALAGILPFGYNNDVAHIYAEQPVMPVPESGVLIFRNIVSPGYLSTLGIPLLGGRPLDERDDGAAPRVAVVNDEMARRLWGTTDVLGRRFRAERDGPLHQVIGVARTAKYRFLTEPPLPLFWVPLAQHYRGALTLHLETDVDPASLAGAARALVAAIDPDLPVYDVRTMREHLYGGHAFLPTKLARSLSMAFGMLALALALVGLYGLVAYSVSRRTREIGIRMALGARVSAVLAMFVREGLAIAGIGTAAGVVAALLAGRAIRGLLIGISPSDPSMIGGAALALLVCAAMASYIPARRAARVDPASTLRVE